ncbi:hypothetical protein LTT66_18440 [Nocardia gipuzkoensis]|uniref:hypothetical protein n=1 Tax=Nocardia gipuzkoensis TaxID=2749991 RepID=UPI001E2D1696|nr:hypothetical protein [Nocardia gipuzkoensis]UGT65349.1 hypothetical protein LTT66_18440 [Nocardia gipuzkoensis]
MSNTALGMTITLSPFILMFIGLTVWLMSDSEGRWGGLLTYSAVTVIMIPVIVGFYVAGNPAWIPGVIVVGGLDLFMFLTALVMIGVGRIRRARMEGVGS